MAQCKSSTLRTFQETVHKKAEQFPPNRFPEWYHQASSPLIALAILESLEMLPVFVEYGLGFECGLRDRTARSLEKDFKIDPAKFPESVVLLEISVSSGRNLHFCQLAERVASKLPESILHKPNYADRRDAFEILLSDQHIENAIQSSSFLNATETDDLSKFDLSTLLRMSKRLAWYNTRYSCLFSEAVASLTAKITLYLSKNFQQAEIEIASKTVDQSFSAMTLLAQADFALGKLINSLDVKLSDLIEKGSACKNYLDDPLTEPDPNYTTIATSAQTLRAELQKASAIFFRESVSQESFETFKKDCFDAIREAKTEFAKFRGPERYKEWYNDIHPILKALVTLIRYIGGIVAALTVVPALLVQAYSKHGYVGTFFNTKTDSLVKLETFEEEFHKVCDNIAKIASSPILSQHK